MAIQFHYLYSYYFPYNYYFSNAGNIRELMHFLPVVYHSNSPPGKVLAIAMFAILCQGFTDYQFGSLLDDWVRVQGIQNPIPGLLSWVKCRLGFTGSWCWDRNENVGGLLGSSLAFNICGREGIEAGLMIESYQDVMWSHQNAWADHVRPFKDGLTHSVPCWSTYHLFSASLGRECELSWGGFNLPRALTAKGYLQVIFPELKW